MLARVMVSLGWVCPNPFRYIAYVSGVWYA